GTPSRREGEQVSGELNSGDENLSEDSPLVAAADKVSGKSSFGSKIKNRLKNILQKDRIDPAVADMEQDDGVELVDDQEQKTIDQETIDQERVSQKSVAQASIRKSHPGLSEAPATQSRAAAARNEQKFYDIADDLVDGRQQLVFIGSFERNGDASSNGDAVSVVEVLGDDVLEAGRSVAIIDAGSFDISEYPGISDLAAGDVDFGEVVIHGDIGQPTIVNWGRLNAISSGSDRPKILVEALCDICEVVIVMVGGARNKSTLPVFAGLDGPLILVAASDPDDQQIIETLAQTKALGFENTSILTLAKRRASNNRINVA
ncbi:hypothetical protein MNBD_ALPHA11-2338, partial [hydrothermal vent metagenome]